MARYYVVTFRHRDTGEEREFTGQGNVRRTAERSARHRLADAVRDITRWDRVATRHAKKENA